MYTGTVDGFCALVTFPEAVRSGWTTFDAVERKQVSPLVRTEAGELTTAIIEKMSPFHATRL